MSIKYHPVFLILALSFASLVSAADPLILYQRIHPMPAGNDRTHRLAVFEDGRVEAHFPSFSPQAGSHQWSLSRGEIQSLLDLVAPIANIDARSLSSTIQSSRSQQLIEVADADTVVLEINDAGRGINRIAVSAPEIWQKHVAERHDMQTVANVASELATWMRNQSEERGR